MGLANEGQVKRAETPIGPLQKMQRGHDFSEACGGPRTGIGAHHQTTDATASPDLRTYEMAVFEETRYAPDASRASATFSARLNGLFGALAAWNDARVTRNALAELSERQLEDIGLTCGDVETL